MLTLPGIAFPRCGLHLGECRGDLWRNAPADRSGCVLTRPLVLIVTALDDCTSGIAPRRQPSAPTVEASCPSRIEIGNDSQE
jgi:hypothetical protein